MSLFPRLRLALLALLAVTLASATPVTRTDAATGIGGPAPHQTNYDQVPPPPDESVSFDRDPLSFDDDSPETDEPSFASAPYGTDARRPIVGRGWLGGFRPFVIPFETGPPAA